MCRRPTCGEVVAIGGGGKLGCAQVRGVVGVGVMLREPTGISCFLRRRALGWLTGLAWARRAGTDAPGMDDWGKGRVSKPRVMLGGSLSEDLVLMVFLSLRCTLMTALVVVQFSIGEIGLLPLRKEGSASLEASSQDERRQTSSHC